MKEENHQVVVLTAINRRGRAIQCRVTCTPLIGLGQATYGVILVVEEVAKTQIPNSSGDLNP